VHAVMPEAGLTGLKGVHASPKGLRPRFRVAAATAGEVF
jgi:hypothetical protein